MIYKLKPYEHQEEIVEMSMKQRDVGLLWEMGCFSGDTLIPINKGGAYMGKIAVKTIYDKVSSGTWDIANLKTRSYNGSGIILNRIVALQATGEKKLYTMTLADGKTIVGTADHKILTDQGWQNLSACLGQEVFVDIGVTKAPKLRYNSRRVGLYHPYAQRKSRVRRDRNNEYEEYFTIEKHRAIYEAFINGMQLGEFLAATKKKESAEALSYVDPSIYHIHHINMNHKDNAISNLAKLPADEHLRIHAFNNSYRSVGLSTVVSIEYKGVEQAYDIGMMSPHNNYVANGIVVHNTGKTGGMINILRAKYLASMRLRRTLILSPLVTLFNWQKEFAIWSNVKQDKIHVLHGTKKQKIMDKLYDPLACAYNGDAVIITNYETLLNKKIFAILMEWNPEIIVLDESQYVKNHKAKRSKAVVKLADRADHRYILSGTPILKNAQDIFMQFRVLDKGETFGTSFYPFQNKYMEDANAQWKHSDNHYPKWKMQDAKVADINSKIYSKCTRVIKADCLDLPPLIKQVIALKLSPMQRKHYDIMKRDLITYITDSKDQPKAVVAQVAIVKALRLMQIASGYVTTDDGSIIEFPDNPKTKAVEELLSEIVDEHKVILWCSFKVNYTQLGKLCEKMKIGHVFLTGLQNLTQKQEAMDAFATDENCRVIIANRRAGGIGVNLVEASYSIVVSRNFALSDELQSEARNYRGGSEKHEKITKIDLVMEDTIEEEVVEALTNKKDIAHSILDMLKE